MVGLYRTLKKLDKRIGGSGIRILSDFFKSIAGMIALDSHGQIGRPLSAI